MRQIGTMVMVVFLGCRSDEKNDSKHLSSVPEEHSGSTTASSTATDSDAGALPTLPPITDLPTCRGSDQECGGGGAFCALTEPDLAVPHCFKDWDTACAYSGCLPAQCFKLEMGPDIVHCDQTR